MENIKILTDESNTTIYINERIYPLSVIMKTAYIFLDKFYIYLDYYQEDIIMVVLKPKKEIADQEMKEHTGEFYNELLNQCLRVEIFKNTKNIRELILARALHSATLELEEPDFQPNRVEFFVSKDEEKLLNSEEDSLGIAVNWFDKENGDKIE